MKEFYCFVQISVQPLTTSVTSDMAPHVHALLCCNHRRCVVPFLGAVPILWRLVKAPNSCAFPSRRCEQWGWLLVKRWCYYLQCLSPLSSSPQLPWGSIFFIRCHLCPRLYCPVQACECVSHNAIAQLKRIILSVNFSTRCTGWC